MTEQEAIALVERQREALEIDPRMDAVSAEKSIVEFMEDRSQPGVAEDRVAWMVELVSNQGFTVVHVDDATGEILEVVRSA